MASRGPHSRHNVLLPVRTTIQNISQLLSLFFRQFRWPARPIAFQLAVHPIGPIALELFRDLGSRRLENPRQLAAGLAFRVQHDRL